MILRSSFLPKGHLLLTINIFIYRQGLQTGTIVQPQARRTYLPKSSFSGSIFGCQLYWEDAQRIYNLLTSVVVVANVVSTAVSLVASSQHDYDGQTWILKKWPGQDALSCSCPHNDTGWRAVPEDGNIISKKKVFFVGGEGFQDVFSGGISPEFLKLPFTVVTSTGTGSNYRPESVKVRQSRKTPEEQIYTIFDINSYG